MFEQRETNVEIRIPAMPLRSKTPPDPQRQLMIKVKACQRLVKEVAYYDKEVKENEATLEEMKASGKDPYDIKKFKEVLGESYMMIPDSKARLGQALTDLEEYLDSPELDDLKSDEWYTQARDLLTEQKGDETTPANNEVQETDLGDLKEGEAF